MADYDRESMMEMFNFEMSQLTQQLEQTLIQGESGFSMNEINEIFRIMHTIKGSAAMMMFPTITAVAHSIEDLFYYLREENPTGIDYSALTDHVLAGMDFIKEELVKIENKETVFGDPTDMVADIEDFLAAIKSGGKLEPPKAAKSASVQAPAVAAEAIVEPKPGKSDGSQISTIRNYKARIHFEPGCEMENVRAFTLLNNNKAYMSDVNHKPADIMSESAIEAIRQNGFIIEFSSNLDYEDLHEQLMQTVYLHSLQLDELSEKDMSQSDKNCFEAVLRFEEGCEMENVRAYTVVHNIKDMVDYITHTPYDLIDESGIDFIREHGFKMEIITSKSYDEIYNILSETIYLHDLVVEQKFIQVNGQPAVAKPVQAPEQKTVQETVKTKNADRSDVEVNTTVAEYGGEQKHDEKQNNTVHDAAAMDGSQSAAKKSPTQTVISVNVSKLDQLLKFMGELVIAEAMVTQNPELENLELDGFHKEARQLKKIIKDLQETIMTMRMISLSTTFYKMNRIVRDMCKQLNKDVQLEIVGDQTEVDKNIIEHISDPLMHIIRNSVDHGIESPEKRRAAGKPERGTVLLEAKSSGSDVLIIVKDDGAGLNKEKIMAKARNNGLLRKPENEYTDKEIFQFINMPGFSTNENVTAYSGRGVGMDVVIKNLEPIKGTVIVDSVPGEGSTFTLKIPLTLAIIEGMIIKLAGAKYTIPIVSIKESFHPDKKDIFTDPNGNEMITVRDACYNIVRLHEFFDVPNAITDFEKGIMMIVENGSDAVCLFLDELVGEQQVVLKNMPKYIKKINGINGCTLLGNGDISLIIDVLGFFDK